MSGISKITLTTLALCLAVSTSGYATSDPVSEADKLRTGTISHFTWLDLDENGTYDIGEQILKDLEVYLYNADSGDLLRQFQVQDEGRFYFKDLAKGSYYLTLLFSTPQKNTFLKPVNENQFIKEAETAVFTTQTFEFDPIKTTRKNINFPFKNNPAGPKELAFTCTDFIDSSYIETTLGDCDNTLKICLEEAIGDMAGYFITDNGQIYTGGIFPCDFDTSYAYTYASIPGGGTAGDYYVSGWAVNGNVYEGIVADMFDLADSMNVWDLNGNWTNDNLTASIRGGNTAVTYGSINISQIATGDPGVIELTTNLNPNGTQLTLDTGYHQLIFMEPLEGCLDTLEVQVNCVSCADLYSGTMDFEIDNCNNDQPICFDLTATAFSAYEVKDNGLLYTGPVNACSADSFYRYDYSGFPDGGTFGPYLLQNWTVNGTVYLGGFNSVSDLVDSMNLWDAGANWDISDPLQTITGGTSGNTYSDLQVIQIVSGDTGLAPVEPIASVTSVEVLLDTGYHELVFYHTSDQCMDSFEFQISCAPCNDYLDGMPIDVMASHCDSSASVCLPIPFAEINEYSLTVNGNLYNNGFESCAMTDTEIRLDTGTYELLLTHISSGCLETGIITVGCIPEVICTNFISETFVPIQAADCDARLCIEIPLDEIAEYAITDNNLEYSGGFTDCQAGTEMAIGMGFHEIIFTHNLTQCADTINSLVACPESSDIDIAIMVNAIDTICLDTLEFMGDIVSINNFCEDNSGELVLIEVNSDSYCLTLEGVEVGTETACIEICDEYGFCDTTYVNVEIEPLVIDPEMPPVASDDFAEVDEGEKIQIDVLLNDEPNGAINSFGILEAPENGTAIVNADNTIEYTPDADFCTPMQPDSFSYVLCNQVDCVEAMVRVAVNCESIIVHNGFSPNGDGRNEYFVINGATANPANNLSVFNRWGGRVYFTEGYQNNWNGTWDGRELPDGTYFYYFEDGNGSTASGYVLIQR